MRTLILFIYVIACVMQTVAVYDAFTSVMGLHGFLAGTVTVLVTWIPVVGALLATIGATLVWGWALLLAAPFFLAPSIAFLAACFSDPTPEFE